MDSSLQPPQLGPLNSWPDTTINPPQFNESQTKLKLDAKSVKNVLQAYGICQSLENNNRQRALRTADMQALCDGAPPRSAGVKRELAQAWQANFSSLWMAGIVGRVSQRFVNAIISQQYVTVSALPNHYENWKTKSDSLRAGFTALVRGWEGNTGFINSVAMETTLQGYCYSVFLDPTTWHPTFFKQDECYMPEKAGQHARDIQYFAAKRDFRLDKFIDLFRDEKAAEAVGYDLDNCLHAANGAVVQDPRADAATTQYRKFVDMVDEGATGIAVTAGGERIVKVWLLFTREYDGQVSFWMIGRDTGKLLRFSFKLFPKMEDTLAMFSFEAGNGCIHSSKGLGRKLAALATVKELFRCGIVDNARMGGMMLLGVNGAEKSKAAPVFMSPFIYVDNSAVDLKTAQQFQVSAEGYKVVDMLIDSWAEQAVGAYLAAQINEQGSTERTATEATIDARRENESADIMIRRCLDQDANRIQMQQLRVCSEAHLKSAKRIYDKIIAEPDKEPEEFLPSDPDEANVMRFLVSKLAEGITENEIKVWSKAPASIFSNVTEGAIQRGITVARAKYAGNPNIDQSALDYADLEGLVGAEMAKKLFIPKANETLAIEAGRAQQTESAVMAGTGQAVLVSPRDNHLIHGGVLQQTLTTIGQSLSNAQAPEALLSTASLNLNHLGEHLQWAESMGLAKEPAFKELSKFYEGFKGQLEQVVQIRQQAQVAQQVAEQQVRLESAPPEAVESVSVTEAPGAFTEALSTETSVPSLAEA
jgi:hypothetical protein